MIVKDLLKVLISITLEICYKRYNLIMKFEFVHKMVEMKETMWESMSPSKPL